MYKVILRQKIEGYYSDDTVSLRFPDVYEACRFVESALPHMEGNRVEIEKLEEKKEGDAEDTAHDTHEQEDENDLPVL